ncbi:MAG: protein kinase, partial [Myxococcota bacterium]
MVATRAEDTMPATPSHLAVESLPAPGTKIGRYTVVDKVGAGGMGVVYRAHDPSLDRDIAIKLVRPTRLRGSGGEQHRARLLREARALAQLQHQNVIRIYDVGEHGEALFFAMEYVLGKDAEQWVTA